MNVIEMADKLGLEVINQGDGVDRTATSIYCCDLLSIVMGRAPQDSAWITVMANSNTVAVAVLADVACIILSEGITLDEDSMLKASQQNVCILAADEPTYDIAKKIDSVLEK